MFTGLIQQVGRLAGLTRGRGGAVLSVAHDPWDTPLQEGESVAVQGICLTVAGIRDGAFQCDVLEETLCRTTLGRLLGESRLNLERALRVGDRFGGHILSGHVDGTGTIVSLSRRGRDVVIRASCGRDLAAEMVTKGSVAVDGISLTLVDVRDDAFEVHVIPHTWEHTSFAGAEEGSAVNIETDMIGKYVRRFLGAQPGGGPGLDALEKAGFI